MIIIKIDKELTDRRLARILMIKITAQVSKALGGYFFNVIISNKISTSVIIVAYSIKAPPLI